MHITILLACFLSFLSLQSSSWLHCTETALVTVSIAKSNYQFSIFILTHKRNSSWLTFSQIPSSLVFWETSSLALLPSYRLAHLSLCYWYFLPIFHISNVGVPGTGIPGYHFLSIYTHFLKYLIYSQTLKAIYILRTPQITPSVQISSTELQTLMSHYFLPTYLDV